MVHTVKRLPAKSTNQPFHHSSDYQRKIGCSCLRGMLWESGSLRLASQMKNNKSNVAHYWLCAWFQHVENGKRKMEQKQCGWEGSWPVPMPENREWTNHQEVLWLADPEYGWVIGWDVTEPPNSHSPLYLPDVSSTCRGCRISGSTRPCGTTSESTESMPNETIRKISLSHYLECWAAWTCGSCRWSAAHSTRRWWWWPSPANATHSSLTKT